MYATLCTTFVLSPSIPSLVQFFLISLYIKLRWWNSWFLSPCCGSNNITQSESNWKWTPLRCPKRPDQLIGSLGPISVQRRPLIKCGFQDFEWLVWSRDAVLVALGGCRALGHRFEAYGTRSENIALRFQVVRADQNWLFQWQKWINHFFWREIWLAMGVNVGVASQSLFVEFVLLEHQPGG